MSTQQYRTNGNGKVYPVSPQQPRSGRGQRRLDFSKLPEKKPERPIFENAYTNAEHLKQLLNNIRKTCADAGYDITEDQIKRITTIVLEMPSFGEFMDEDL